MLSIWRNTGESIVIGGSILLTPIASTLEHVRLRVVAPELFDGERIARIALHEEYRVTADVVVHIAELGSRGGARFHIEAPREITVDREEVHAERERRRHDEEKNRCGR